MPYRATPGRAVPGKAVPGWATEVATTGFVFTGTGSSSGSVEFVIQGTSLTFTGTGSSTGSILFGLRHALVFTGTSSSSGSVVFTSLYIYITPIEADATMSATIREATPTATDLDSETIRVDDTTSAEKKALVRVPLRVPVGVGATILRGELFLYKAAAWSGSATLTAEPVDESWDAETVTWATVPDVRAESATATVATAGAAGDEVTVNVTTLLETAVAADDASGSRWYGLLLSSDLTGDNTFFSETASNPAYVPYLKVEYSIPPDSPTALKPSGGRSVSETLPLLEGQFHDSDADDTCGFVQVEVGTDETFEDADYISVKAASTSPRFDLNSPPTGASITLATSAAADDIIDTSAAHGLVENDRAVFTSLTGGTGLTAGTVYYVIAANLAATTFQVSETEGGSAALFTTDITAGSTAPVALTPGTTYYHRMRTWDNHGIASEWSAAAEFSVVAKGSLTVTDEGATIDSPTPLTEWTFTPDDAEAQESVEVEYEIKVDGTWKRHYIFPKTVTAATSHQLPNADRLVDGFTYRRSVRLWDDVDREDMAGDRAYLEDQQEFTLTALVEA